MNSLSRLDVAKLAKVAAMFSSPYDGERAVAAALADRMVKAAGLTWHTVLQPPPIGRARVGRPLSPADILARHDDLLTDWERAFLWSLARAPGRLSTKQAAKLSQIRQRVLDGAA